MATIAKDTGGSFTPAPEGIWQAVCCDVIAAYGVVRKKPVTNEEYKRDEVRIVFQIDEMPETKKRYLVSRTFGLSLAEKSHLRPFLESWRGRKFTAEDLQNGFDVEKLIGVNCQLQVLHNNGYANIQSIMPLGKGQTQMTVEGYTRKEAAPAAAETVSAAAAAAPVADETIPF